MENKPPQKNYSKKRSEMSSEELLLAHKKDKKYYETKRKNNPQIRRKRSEMTDEELVIAHQKDKENYEKNKEKILKKERERREKNQEQLSKLRKERYWKNPDKSRRQKNESYKRNSEKRRKYAIEYEARLRREFYDVLGQKCCVCGLTDMSKLTMDHINGNGRADREKNGGFSGIIRNIKKMDDVENYIKENFEVRCYNHNLGRRRGYLDLPPEKQTYGQKDQTKLWKEAFNFFGPCEKCGESDLKFLCIDHRNGGGTKERIGGGKFGVSLIREFRKQGWPESIKETYRFLCYNHNCCSRSG